MAEDEEAEAEAAEAADEERAMRAAAAAAPTGVRAILCCDADEYALPPFLLRCEARIGVTGGIVDADAALALPTSMVSDEAEDAAGAAEADEEVTGEVRACATGCGARRRDDWAEAGATEAAAEDE